MQVMDTSREVSPKKLFVPGASTSSQFQFPSDNFT